MGIIKLAKGDWISFKDGETRSIGVMVSGISAKCLNNRDETWSKVLDDLEEVCKLSFIQDQKGILRMMKSGIPELN